LYFQTRRFLVFTICRYWINDHQGRVNFDPRAIIWTIFVEVYQTMPFAKYLSSRPCLSLQEDFFAYNSTATRFLPEIKIFEQFWKPFPQGTILPSLVENGLGVFHKFTTVYYLYNRHTHRWIAICHQIELIMLLLHFFDYKHWKYKCVFNQWSMLIIIGFNFLKYDYFM
jgi:hypothetical protein